MKKEKSYKKPHENLIGKVITAFLMFIPLFAIGVTCGYAMFNKNAYQSYDNVVNTVETKLIDGDTLYQAQLYQVYYNGKDSDYTVTSQTIRIIEGSTNIVEKMFPNETWIASRINFTYEGNRQRTIIYDTNNIQHNKFNYFIDNPTESIYFQPNQDHTFLDFSKNYVNYFNVTYNYGKISNVFYYSIDKVQESSLFNWTENTAMYTVLHNFTNGLGIQATFFPMLLTYWLMIYLCYILYDFALIPLNIIHRKIHETSETL